jgi:hypothetical protein
LEPRYSSNIIRRYARSTTSQMLYLEARTRHQRCYIRKVAVNVDMSIQSQYGEKVMSHNFSLFGQQLAYTPRYVGSSISNACLICNFPGTNIDLTSVGVDLAGCGACLAYLRLRGRICALLWCSYYYFRSERAMASLPNCHPYAIVSCIPCTFCPPTLAQLHGAAHVLVSLHTRQLCRRRFLSVRCAVLMRYDSPI